ncbi:MAG: rhodanese-like domain-containing protein [Pseudomonadota bacterium]
MSNQWRRLLLIFSTIFLVACSEQEPAQSSQSNVEPAGIINVAPSSDSHEHSTPDFTPNYISAEDLNSRFEERSEPFIFDVRSKVGYEKSHIKSALWVPYGNTKDSDLAKITGLDKNSEIVTYCGCPRHLSTLQAKFLTDLGYSNVKVLYDGLWVWQDSGFPTIYGQAAQTTLLKFSGSLASTDRTTMETDVFLRHVRSGQLEAARTSADGRFTFDFHLYGYQSNDEFELMISELDSVVVKTVAPTSTGDHNDIQIDVFL